MARANTLTLVAALADTSSRAPAARALAAHFGADDLIVFVRDDDVGVLLPAPGFRQTLPGGREWRTFVESCAPGVVRRGNVPLVVTGESSPVLGIASGDRYVLVLVGGEPHEEHLEDVATLLPLLGAAFAAERGVVVAAGRATLADQAAAQAKALAEALVATRVELERALTSAEEAARLKDEFLATISHELRTPLNAMLGWVRLLRRGDLDAETTQRGVESIERNVVSQAKLVEDLLDVSHATVGQLRVALVPVDLKPILVELVESARPAAAAKGLTLELEVSDSAVISGDATRLRQIFWNLVSNGVKFTPADGRVSVRLAVAGPNVEVTVTDTGPGIPAAFLPYVFDPFRQADSSITREHGGLGLGLAIARQLVEAHGGDVRVESDPALGGSTFAVRLPLATDSAVAPYLGETAPTDVPELAGVRVLVVVDDPGALGFVEATMTACGADVSTASTAREALAELERTHPDALVSDVGTTRDSVYALINSIRASDGASWQRIPAVALTSDASGAERAKALEAGFDAFLSKPVELFEVAAAVRDAVRVARLRT